MQILALRRVNPDPLPPPFVGGTAVGQWRPTPSFLGNPPAPAPFSPMAVPWMAKFDPFTLTSPARFRSEPPPALTSERYTRDFKEVKDFGSLVSTARSAEQTDLAYFYSGNIPAQWNSALRGIATRYLRRTGDSARLFALANMATADALISSWDSKAHYVFWRPVTAIVEADHDGNPETIADPTWQPLINTPNYPDYTSGANNVAGSMTRTLELFFGTDRVTFEVTTAVPLAVRKVRTYRRFSDAADDMVEARMLLGIHFRFADTAGRRQGRRVARLGLQPLPAAVATLSRRISRSRNTSTAGIETAQPVNSLRNPDRVHGAARPHDISLRKAAPWYRKSWRLRRFVHP
jgi:hypothetical protein